jgi:hypothetical protein
MKVGKLGVSMAVLLCALALAITSPAWADGYSWVHGAAARVENPDDTNSNKITGQGLVMNLPASTSVWVHIPLSTPIMVETPKANAISMSVATGSSDVKVTAISVYNGATKVKDLTFTSFSSPGANKFVTKSFTLGKNAEFGQGMGISIKVTAGSNTSANHGFALGAAGAYWIGALQVDSSTISSH